MGVGIQLRGKEQVIEAYNNVRLPKFALWQGTALLFSYKKDSLSEGEQLLDQWLTLLQENETTAIYTIMIYERINADGRITNKTEYDNKLFFKLYDAEGEFAAPGIRAYKRIQELEEQLAEKEAEGEKIGGFQGWIAGMLEKPEVQSFLLNQVVGIVGSIGAFFKRPMQPAAVGSVPDQNETMPDEQAVQDAYASLSEEEKKKLDQAMGILLTKDRESVGTNLLKLAKILDTDPAKYRMLAAMV